jgi:hypothetical protein
MKFYVRRAIAGIVSIPFVAGAYTFFYFTLLVLGGEPNQTIGDTYENGLYIGGTLAIVFVFAPQFTKFIKFLEGENN